jgi:PAS domain S-box-containing protein
MTLAESGLRQLEYKNSQKELAKNQEYLNTIIDSVSDAIFINDLHGKIIDVNHTAVAMFGYSKDELINMNVNDIVSEESHTKLQLLDILDKARSKNPVILECICNNKSNNTFWAEVSIRAIYFLKRKKS